MFKYKYTLHYRRYFKINHKDGTSPYIEGSTYKEKISLWGLILTLVRGRIEPKVAPARFSGGRFVLCKIVKDGRRI